MGKLWSCGIHVCSKIRKVVVAGEMAEIKLIVKFCPIEDIIEHVGRISSHTINNGLQIIKLQSTYTQEIK